MVTMLTLRWCLRKWEVFLESGHLLAFQVASALVGYHGFFYVEPVHRVSTRYNIGFDTAQISTREHGPNLAVSQGHYQL